MPAAGDSSDLFVCSASDYTLTVESLGVPRATSNRTSCSPILSAAAS